MTVFVDTKFGVTFTFDLDPRNTKVFDIKNSIEYYQGIPVSTQTLYFEGAELAVDHYQLRVYRIVNNSRLRLEVSDDHVNNQMLLRHSPSASIQGFVPSMATRNMPPFHANASESFLNQDLLMMPRRSNQVLHQTQIPRVPPSHASESFYNQDQRTITRSNQEVPPSHASESFYNQDQRTVARSNQEVPPSHASEAFYNQDRLVSNEGQAGESVLESFSMDEFLERAREPWTAQDSRKMQDIWPAGTTGDNVKVQESSGRGNEKNQDLFQSDKSTLQQQKLTVTMTQYDKPGRKFPLEVNANDNVEELKKELEYLLDLRPKGYFLLHKERVLDDDMSFCMNRVANGDTIEIFPGPDLDDYNT